MNLRHFCRKTAGFLLTAAILMGGTITAYASLTGHQTLGFWRILES